MGWTYVNGQVIVDTLSKTPLKDVKQFLKTAPTITGEEYDCQIFLSRPAGSAAKSTVIITLFGQLRWRSTEETVAEYKAFMNALTQRFDEIDFENVRIENQFREGETFFTSFCSY